MSDEPLTYQKYQRRLDLMADAIEEHYDSEADDLPEYVFEEVDASDLVLYTSNALGVLRVSDAGPTEWHHMVGDDDSWQNVVSTMAFTALRADLWSKLERRDIAHDIE